MSLEEIKFWLTIANIIGTALLGAFMFLSKRNDDTGARVTEVEKALIAVQAELKHMPTHLEMQKINSDLGTLKGETDTQTALLTRMERQMSLINEWMMENK